MGNDGSPYAATGGRCGGARKHERRDVVRELPAVPGALPPPSGGEKSAPRPAQVNDRKAEPIQEGPATAGEDVPPRDGEAAAADEGEEQVEALGFADVQRTVREVIM